MLLLARPERADLRSERDTRLGSRGAILQSAAKPPAHSQAARGVLHQACHGGFAERPVGNVARLPHVDVVGAGVASESGRVRAQVTRLAVRVVARHVRHRIALVAGLREASLRHSPPRSASRPSAGCARAACAGCAHAACAHAARAPGATVPSPRARCAGHMTALPRCPAGLGLIAFSHDLAPARSGYGQRHTQPSHERGIACCVHRSFMRNDR